MDQREPRQASVDVPSRALGEQNPERGGREAAWGHVYLTRGSGAAHSVGDRREVVGMAMGGRFRARRVQDDGARPALVTTLGWVLGFVGITALPSGVLMMAFPDGALFGMPLTMLEFSPFETFFVPGLLLFAFLGVLPLVAAWLLRTDAWPSWAVWIERVTARRAAWLAAGASGVATVVWIVTQVVMIRGFHVLHGIYGVLGVAIVALTLAPSVRAWGGARRHR